MEKPTTKRNFGNSHKTKKIYKIVSVSLGLLLLTQASVFAGSDDEDDSIPCSTVRMTSEEIDSLFESAEGGNASGLEQLIKLVKSSKDPQLLCRVGCIYRDVEEKPNEALKWFGLAYKQGDEGALYSITSIKTRELEARNLSFLQLKEVADTTNDQYALIMVGEAYEEGEGVKKNLSEALRYYQLASDQGHPSGESYAQRVKITIEMSE